MKKVCGVKKKAETLTAKEKKRLDALVKRSLKKTGGK